MRKVVVRAIRAGKATFYIRPVHDLELLIESEQSLDVNIDLWTVDNGLLTMDL